MLIAKSRAKNAPYEIHRVNVFGVFEYQGRTLLGSKKIEQPSITMEEAIRKAHAYIRTASRGTVLPSLALQFV